MKNASAMMICAVFALSLSATAGAAGDPWVGTWHRHGKNGAPDVTLKVTPTAGGYTFAKKQSDAPVEMSVPVIADGHPHAANGPLGPMTATCRHVDARTITCKLSMSGLESDLRYELAPDGKSLTDSESDPEPPGKAAAYTDHIVLQRE